MDVAALAAFALLAGVLVGLVAYLIVSQRQQRQQQQQAPQAAAAQEDEDAGEEASGSRVRRGSAMDRMRASRLRHRRAQAQAAAGPAAGRSDDSGTESDDEEEEEEGLTRKEQRKREREAQREAERSAREARANKVSAYEERRRKKEEEREAQERAQEEEVARAAAERQKREDEEAAKWMGMISVEQAGTEVEAAADASALVQRFVDYIQQRKMVPIEEVAAEFGMRSSEVVDRIQGLEAMERLTGVMDERGKFIYISRDEMEAVAGFIRKKGRVHIAELAAQSASLIDLEPRAAAPVESTAGASISFDDVLADGSGIVGTAH